LIEYINGDIFSQLFYGVTEKIMSIGDVVFSLMVLCLVGGVVLWISALLKKNRTVSDVMMLIIGAVLFAVPAFISMYNSKNNSSPEYGFSKSFTELDKEFTEIYKSNKKPVAGINAEITGYINGKGKLLIIHQPYERNEGLTFELEEKIYERIENTDWYTPECLIKFVPADEFAEGNILINIEMR
jgi:hypothetical protein